MGQPKVEEADLTSHSPFARPLTDSAAGGVLKVVDLRVYYDTPEGVVKAVDGVTFSLRRGERLALVGESGCGKTTLAMALMRLTKEPGHITGGAIWLDGIDLLDLSEEEMRNTRLSKIALIPQGAMNSLNPVMRVKGQIIDGISAHDGSAEKAEMNSRVAELLSNVGLSNDVAQMYPHELSGGMKQRVAMAIATALAPQVIVADEPTSALDVVVQRHIMVTLGQLQEGIDASIILVGHDMGLVAQFAHTVGVMYAGKLVELAPVGQIFKNPQHPYTRLLIESLPSLEEKRDFQGIPGLPPPLIDLPRGCPFADRCPSVMDVCRVEDPVFHAQGERQFVACHLYPEDVAS